MPKKSPQSSELFNKRDVLAYFVVAATGAVVQIICAKYLFKVHGLGWEVSLTIAYYVALVVGFWLTKVFAFDAKQTQKTRREMVKYLAISSFAGGVMVAFANLTLDIINGYYPSANFLPQLRVVSDDPKELIAHVSGMGFSFVTNYVGHKTITFKSTGFYDRIKTKLKL
jgi:putative flippase GtrA